MAAFGYRFGFILPRKKRLAGAVTPPTPSPLLYTVDPTKKYYAANGFRIPNRTGSLTAGMTQYGQKAMYPEGIYWDMPAGGQIEWTFANFNVHEASQTIHEDPLTNDHKFRVFFLYYTDINNVARIVPGVLSNGGIAQAGVIGGHVRATCTLPAAYKKGTPYRIGLGIEIADGVRVPTQGVLGLTGDIAKMHAVDNFDSRLASDGNLVFTGSNGISTATGNWSGFYIHPICVRATNCDGRWAVAYLGDSHNYGKGYESTTIAPNRVAGECEIGMTRTNGGATYKVPGFNTSIAGSGSLSDIFDLRKYTMAVIDSHAADNGGVDPFHFYMSNEGTNTVQTTAATQVTMINNRNNQWKQYRNHPVFMTTQFQKFGDSNNPASKDGFQSYEGQSPNGAYLDTPNSPSFGFNTLLMSGQVSSVAYGVNVADTMRHANSKDRISTRTFNALLTRDTTAGAQTIYLNAAPQIGEALVLDPLPAVAGQTGTGQTRIVSAVTTITAGSEYMVKTETGSSAGTYPARAAGTFVGATWIADGTSFNIGLHVTLLGHLAMSPNFDALKAAVKAANNGTFTDAIAA